MATHRIARNIGWKTAGVVVEKGLRLVLVALVARALGTATYGQYTYAVALALLTVQMTDMGLGLFLAREIARAEAPPPKLVGHVLTLKGLLSLAYLAVVAVIAWVHADEPALAWTLGLAGVAGLCTSLVEAAWQVFRGVQRLELEARSSAVYAAVQLGVTGATLAGSQVAGLTSTQIMVTVSAAMAVAGLVAVAHAWSLVLKVVRPLPGWSRETLRRFAVEVLPLGLAIVASLVYFKIDVLMLREMRGDVETGLYNAGYKVFENLAAIPAVLMAATFPALSRAVHLTGPEAGRLHRKTLSVLVAAGVGAGLVLALFPSLITRLLYGDQFGPSADVLQALAPSVLLTFVNYLETHMLVALGLVWPQFAMTAALIGVNIAANLVLIPKWGGVGAAVATALTELALFAMAAPLVWYGLRRARAHAHATASAAQIAAEGP